MIDVGSSRTVVLLQQVLYALPPGEAAHMQINCCALWLMAGDVTNMTCTAGESDGLWTGIQLGAESFEFAVEPTSDLQSRLTRRIAAMEV